MGYTPPFAIRPATNFAYGIFIIYILYSEAYNIICLKVIHKINGLISGINLNRELNFFACKKI